MRRPRDSYVDDGYLWNSGNFMFRARLFLTIPRVRAESAAAITAAVEGAGSDLGFITLDAADFGRATAKSVDYAVMEKTRRAAVVPVSFGWSDVGSWHSVWELSPQGCCRQRRRRARRVFVDAKSSYAVSDKALVALLGVENLVVVASEDAVLVANRNRVDDMRQLVDQLKTRSLRSDRRASARCIGRGALYHSLDRAPAIRSSGSS